MKASYPTALRDRPIHDRYILETDNETGNDRYRFKNSSVQKSQKRVEKSQPLTTP